MGMPSLPSLSLVPRWTGFPISSVLVAAEAIKKCSARPSLLTMSFITNSAMGERQILPWQIKSTRILIKTPFKMRCPAAICSDLRGVNSSLCIGHFCTKNANLSKILQDVYSNRSRNVVKSGWDYY